jgi:hypothetical protein
MGVIGYTSPPSKTLSIPLFANSVYCRDLSEAFPNGEYANLFRADWLTHMVKEVRSNRDFSDRTITTARWAREQIKRQTGTLTTSSPYHVIK